MSSKFEKNGPMQSAGQVYSGMSCENLVFKNIIANTVGSTTPLIKITQDSQSLYLTATALSPQTAAEDIYLVTKEGGLALLQTQYTLQVGDLAWVTYESQYYRWDGASWVLYQPSTQFGTPGGPEYAIQFHTGSTATAQGEFSGSGNFTYNYVSNHLKLTGSLYVTGSTQSPGSGHLITYNTASGLFSYTASSAVGGGGSPTDVTNLKSGSFGITVDGQGSTVTTGDAGYILIPYNCTMSGWFMFGDQVGSIGIDLRRDTYNTFPAVQADTICGGFFPTMSSEQKSSGSVAGWTTTTLNSGDIINFNVTSSSTVTRVNLIVNVIKS